MGAWGAGIFQDDTACDIRDNYKDHLGNGLSGSEATLRILKDYASSFSDPDESGVAWLALAATQWKLGRLDAETLGRALQVIDSGSDLKRWAHDPKQLKLRRAVLEKMRAQITSPQPSSKKIARRALCESPWRTGDLFSWRLPSENIIVFRVIDHHTDRGGTYPVCQILDWTGKEIPSKQVLKLAGTKPSRDDYKHKIYNLMLVGLRKKWFKRIQSLDINLTPLPQRMIGSVTGVLRIKRSPASVVHVKRLDSFLKEWFLLD